MTPDGSISITDRPLMDRLIRIKRHRRSQRKCERIFKDLVCSSFLSPIFFIDCIRSCIQVSGLGFTNKHYVMRRSIIVPTVTLSYIRTYRLTATSRQRPLHFVPEDRPYILILFQLYHCSKHKLSTILIANVAKLACVAWK